MKVLGIDIGYANLAYCMIDTRYHLRPTHWHCERVYFGGGQPTEDQLIAAMMNWCDVNDEMLQSAHAIVLERQLQDKFKLMNCVVQVRYFAKTFVRGACTVGARFGLPTKRGPKKKAAVALVKKLFTGLPVRDKDDDLADAALLALYHLDDLGIMEMPHKNALRQMIEV